MIDRYVRYFTYYKDAQDPEKAMQGRYFILSTTLFFSLTFIAIPYFVFVSPEDLSTNKALFWENIVFTSIIIGMLFIYKRWGLRIVLVNFMTLLGYSSNWQTYDLNGALWSTDLLWGIVISAWVFLVADRWSGTIWMFITMITYACMLYFMNHSDHDFVKDAIHLGPGYPLSNYLLGAAFILLIIWMYDSSKRKFLDQLRTSNTEIEVQKKELESQQEDIIASINYAKKIQQAVLPHEEMVTRGIPLSFFLYQPRNIVSGDFYWYHEIDRDNYILACADCTGHGVPGAFMTVIGSNILSQIVKDNGITAPGEILKQLDLRINETLKQDHARYSEVQDGMDLSIVRVNKAKNELVFTSAKRVAFLVRNNELRELKGSKFSIGGMRSDEKTFHEITVQYTNDDLLYMFTDGYIDQFGGPDNKKFMIKRFRELILSVNKLPMPDQKKKLRDTIAQWIGTNEQTDDILVLGIRF